MKKGKLIIFCAPSGSGKTTLVNRIMKSDLPLAFSVSATSRKAREHEENGVHYYFLSAEEFRTKIANDEFLEWEEVYTDQYYGSLKSDVERLRNEGKHVVFDIDVVGGAKTKKMFGDDALAIFIKAPSIEEIQRRLSSRGTEDEASLKKRLDKTEFELGYAKEFDVVVVNDILEDAEKEILDLINNFVQ
jgi:guanylate kinase